MKSRRSYGLLILLGAVAVCCIGAGRSVQSAETNTRTQTIKFGVPFKIGLQKSVALPGSKTAFTFARLSDDSRCPAGRECVWEGEVKTLFTLRRAGKTIGNARLTIRGRNRVIAESAAYVKPYRIKLLRVDPYPGDPDSATTPIQATVRIDKGPTTSPTARPKKTPTPVPQPVKKLE